MGIAEDIQVAAFEGRLRRRAAEDRAREGVQYDHPAAYVAAQESLAASGLPNAGVRNELARRVLVELVALRTHHGAGFMTIVAGRADLREAMIRRVWTGNDSGSTAAIDEAMAAAARVLAETS